jgi:alkylation response protein AidB-like acyl-CoA dehydrogenase
MDFSESDRVSALKAELEDFMNTHVYPAEPVYASQRASALAKGDPHALAVKVLDRAIQTFGAAGVSQDTPLASWWAHARTLRLADGPDEVHVRSLARREFRPGEERLKARREHGVVSDPAVAAPAGA